MDTLECEGDLCIMIILDLERGVLLTQRRDVYMGWLFGTLPFVLSRAILISVYL